MEKSNNLSNNLKAYQQARNLSLIEFSEELSIPKSTLRSVMRDGNTTLDTAIRLAEGMGVSLDDLVYDKRLPERLSLGQLVLRGLEWYTSLSAETQATVASLLNEIMKAVAK